MVQTAQQNGAADHGFPFGIDPRDFGLSKLEYDRTLDHHRRMEHLQAQQREHETHRHEMDEAQARERAANAELEARYYWLQPLNAFCKWFGGAFWVVVWAYAILSVMLAISNANKAADDRMKDVAVKECLANLDKCKSGLGSGWMKEAVR